MDRDVALTTFGRVIRLHRGGRTQAEIADAAGIHFMTYRRWEAGALAPTLPRLPALADALGVDLLTLIDEWLRELADTPTEAGG